MEEENQEVAPGKRYGKDRGKGLNLENCMVCGGPRRPETTNSQQTKHHKPKCFELKCEACEASYKHYKNGKNKKAIPECRKASNCVIQPHSLLL